MFGQDGNKRFLKSKVCMRWGMDLDFSQAPMPVNNDSHDSGKFPDRKVQIVCYYLCEAIFIWRDALG